MKRMVFFERDRDLCLKTTLTLALSLRERGRSAGEK
jgi:hypothetical protein